MIGNMILGHLAGDYIFQNDAMAILKTEKSLFGLFVCISHCTSYALWVSIFLNGAVELPFMFIFSLAFISHFFIDRYSLASKWMDWFHIMQQDSIHYAKMYRIDDRVEAICKFSRRHDLFYGPVYIGVDNGLHLIVLYMLLVDFTGGIVLC